MTEATLNIPLYFSALGINIRAIKINIGRLIHATPEWFAMAPDGLEQLTDNITVTYSSRHVAIAFYERLNRVYSLGNYPTADLSTSQMCSLILEELARLKNTDSDSIVLEAEDYERAFLTSLAFGFTDNAANSYFGFLSWGDRRHLHKISMSYERLNDQIQDILKENFKNLVINCNEDSRYAAYSTDQIQTYDIGGLKVYSKIPEAIAKSFSYFLRVEKVSSYLGTTQATYLLPEFSNKTLSCGPTADILFAESYSEEYDSSTSSNEKVEVHYLKTPSRSTISLQFGSVRKKTLKNTCSIIPIIDKVLLLDPATLEATEVNFLRIRINSSLNKFFKYKSSKGFLDSIPAKFFSYEGLAWIDPDVYAIKMRKMMGDICKYSPNFVSVIMNSGVDVSTFSIPENTLPTESISNSAFRYHEVNSVASEISELANFATLEANYKALCEKVGKWTTDLEAVQYAHNHSDAQCKRHNDNIEYWLRQAELAKKALQQEQDANVKRVKDIESFKTNIEAVQGSLNELAQQVEAGKAKRIETALTHADSVEVNWLDNVKKSNIDFNCSYYSLPVLWSNQDLHELVIHDLVSSGFSRQTHETFYISVEDCPELAFYAQEKLPIPLELIFGDNADQVRSLNLHEKKLIPALAFVQFSTIEPSVISVNGSATRQVVGGPYQVQVSANLRYHPNGNDEFRKSPSLTLRLKNESSVFGYNQNGTVYNLWIHPHTNFISYSINEDFFKNVLNYCANGCLGDAAPSLYKGFEESNVRTVVFAAKTWIESANPTDTWGKHYKYFPKVEDVRFDQEPAEVVESQEISEVEVNEMLQDLMDQATDEESTNQVARPQVTVDTVTPVINIQETPEIEVAERINQIVREAIQETIGEQELVTVESTPPDSPPSPAYTTYAEVAAGN